MRHLKTGLALAVMVCACGVAAVPAMAHEFTVSREIKGISPEFPGRLMVRNPAEAEQTFKFGSFKIKCTHAVSTKAEETPIISTSFKSFAANMKYSKCKTFIALVNGNELEIATKFVGVPYVTYVYHANGFVEAGTEVEESEEAEGAVKISGGEFGFKVSGLKCRVTLPAQTIPGKAIKKPEEEYSEASYSNLLVDNGKLKYFPKENSRCWSSGTPSRS